MTSLALDDVSVRYGCVAAVENLSLSIKSGDSIAITGPSGSGKTTSLRLLSGLLRPTSGEVLIDDVPIGGFGERRRAQLRAKEIGFVYQDYNLLPYLSALQNVEVTSRLRSGPLSARNALERVGLLSRAAHLVSELSGGEQQRVSVARALCGNPNIIVADEPTGALDSDTGDTVLNLLLEANHDGVTLIVVTHASDVAERMRRRVRLQAGRVVEEALT